MRELFMSVFPYQPITAGCGPKNYPVALCPTGFLTRLDRHSMQSEYAVVANRERKAKINGTRPPENTAHP